MIFISPHCNALYELNNIEIYMKSYRGIERQGLSHIFWIDIGSAQINLHLVVRTQIWVILLVCWANTKASRPNIIPSRTFSAPLPPLETFLKNYLFWTFLRPECDIILWKSPRLWYLGVLGGHIRLGRVSVGTVIHSVVDFLKVTDNWTLWQSQNYLN